MSESIPPLEELDRIYSSVLDQLLFPPHVKEQLLSSQPPEKKWQQVLLHKTTTENKEDMKTLSWSDKDRKLLSDIRKSKQPDIKSLLLLKTILSTANREYMNNFFDAGGCNVLVKCIDDRIARVPMTNLDAALLYEIMACIKTIMNNTVGMEGVIEHSNAIERIAETLRFEWKPLAMQVLEILSVSCYYSDRSTKLVINGMKRLAKSRQESVYHILSKALVEQDIEVKAGVMQFINNIIMGLDDLRSRLHVRSEFSARLLQENFNTAMDQVNTDISFINEVGANINSPEHAKRRLELVSLHGPKAMTSLSAFLEQNTVDNDIVGRVITVGTGKNITQYVPSQGQMASCLIAAKNKDKNMQGTHSLTHLTTYSLTHLRRNDRDLWREKNKT